MIEHGTNKIQTNRLINQTSNNHHHQQQQQPLHSDAVTGEQSLFGALC